MNSDIFKTLISALTTKKEKSTEQEEQKSTTTPQDLISAFSKFLSGANFSAKEKTDEKKENSSQTTLTKDYLQPPLQTGMLETMNSHDSFVKRVKEKNQKA